MSVLTRKYSVLLITFITLVISIVLDLLLNELGQLFSASGAILIIYAIIVWNQDKKSFEAEHLKYSKVTTTLLEEASSRQTNVVI